MFDVRRSAPAPTKARSANVMVMRIPNTTASIPPDESGPANRRPRTPSLTPVPVGTNTTRNPATQANAYAPMESAILEMGRSMPNP